VDVIAGYRDAPMMFQTFDDKGEQRDLAGTRFGKLSSGKIQAWLVRQANAGAGVYVVPNQCDGEGRRRANVWLATSAWIDLDGKPFPTSWPIPPDIIVQT